MTRTSTSSVDRAGRLGALDRLLSPFTEVRPGEGPSALLLTFNIFLLLTAYYLLKTIREPLVLAAGGAAIKSYASAGQAILLIFVVRAYGAIAKRFGRMVLIGVTVAFFVSNLAVFALLLGLGVPIGIPFFLWVGCFSLTMIAQSWSLANDVYTPEQGKRLFAVVGVGSSLGAMFGAWLAGFLYEVPARGRLVWVVQNAIEERPAPGARVGEPAMMLLAAAILLLCLGVMFVVHRREPARGAEARTEEKSEEKGEEARPIGDKGALRLVLGDRYLLLLALLALILNWVNTTGEFILDRRIVDMAKEATGQTEGPAFRAVVGQFRGVFFFAVNTVGAAIQLLLVSRIFKFAGVPRALLILPVVALFGYGFIAFVPVLALVRYAKIAENSIDYSIQNTARQALFLPTSREAKYSAKAAIDTFFVRAGDVLSAVLVFVGTSLAFRVEHFALVNIVLILAWIYLVVRIGRLYRDRSPDSRRPARSGA